MQALVEERGDNFNRLGGNSIEKQTSKTYYRGIRICHQ